MAGTIPTISSVSSGLTFAAQVFAGPDMFFAALGNRRVVARKLNALPESVAVRPKFFRQDFIDDRDLVAAGLGRFRFVENAAAQDRQIDRRESNPRPRCPRPR